LNLTRSDFKYPTDLRKTVGFRIGHIPMTDIPTNRHNCASGDNHSSTIDTALSDSRRYELIQSMKVTQESALITKTTHTVRSATQTCHQQREQW